MLRRQSIAWVILASAAASLGCLQMAVVAQELKLGERELLTIGSPAPALDIEHWIFDGEGKYKPVKKFEAGKTYVIEFWATWCGPCVASMPHIAALQQQYADQGVQIISVSDEDVETIQEFLKKKVPNRGRQADGNAEKESEDKKAQPAQTFGELTKVYCLTTDPDGSTNKDYMEAARQGGIPTAFIVGKDSKIEWIGHPMELDEPLKAVVEDKWDREKFHAEMKARQEAELAMERISTALAEKDFDKALDGIDSQIDTLKGPEQKLQFQQLKFQVLVLKGDVEQARTHLFAVLKSLEGNGQLVNMLTWSIYEMSEQGQLDDKAALEVAISGSQKAAKGADGALKGSLLDTVAHLLYKTGALDKAIEAETEAAKLAGPQDKDFIQQFLEQLKKEKTEATKKK